MWQDFISGQNPLVAVFDTIPDITEIEMNQISLQRSGEMIEIIFDIEAFPQNPPSKWKDLNTLQIHLFLTGVQNFKLENWKIPTQGKLTAEKNDDNSLINVAFTSAGCTFRAQVQALMIQKINAYLNSSK